MMIQVIEKNDFKTIKNVACTGLRLKTETHCSGTRTVSISCEASAEKLEDVIMGFKLNLALCFGNEKCTLTLNRGNYAKKLDFRPDLLDTSEVPAFLVKSDELPLFVNPYVYNRFYNECVSKVVAHAARLTISLHHKPDNTAVVQFELALPKNNYEIVFKAEAVRAELEVFLD